MRSCQKLFLCPVETISMGSKTDPLLAKAKPIRDSGSVSGIRYLRKKKKKVISQKKRGVRICEGNKVLELRFSCRPWCRPW